MGNLTFNRALNKMITLDVTINNNIILEFVGEHSLTIDQLYGDISHLRFHNSWDWLIPACKVWDDLWFEGMITPPDEYVELSDRLDDKVTTYEMDDVYEQLVINIRWYNDYRNSQI